MSSNLPVLHRAKVSKTLLKKLFQPSFTGPSHGHLVHLPFFTVELDRKDDVTDRIHVRKAWASAMVPGTLRMVSMV
jgi:hypothetical protein